MFASLKALLPRFFERSHQDTGDSLAQNSFRREEIERHRADPTQIEAICTSRLRGKSGGSYYKSESPPDRAPLFAAVNSLVDDFGAAALPFIVPKIRATTRCGDYNDSTSYSDVLNVVDLIKRRGLSEEMLQATLDNINSQGWTAQVMTAAQSFCDPRLVNPLLSYLIRSGSVRSPLSHYSRYNTVAEYCQEFLADIAGRNGGSVENCCLEAALNPSEICTLKRGHDKVGVEVFSGFVLKAFKSNALMNERALLQLKNMISHGLISPKVLSEFDEFLDSARERTNPDLFSRLKLEVIKARMMSDPPPDGQHFERFYTNLILLDSSVPEVSSFLAIVEAVVTQIKDHPEFDPFDSAAKLFAEAYRQAEEDGKFTIKLVPPTFDRFHKKTASTPEDPQAARDPSGLSDGYFRYEPVSKLTSPARLVVSAAA